MPVVLGFAIVFGVHTPGQSCTAFCYQHESGLYVGRNYDWFYGGGALMVNQRNLEKKAFLMYPSDAPAEWVSKYGSITFNQHGKEFPLGGMNEKGLVVEVLWLNETQFPTQKDHRSVLNELQWVQYQLDNCLSVDEVVASDQDVRIGESFSAIHFFVSDATGASAVIEFLSGKMVVSKERNTVFQAITNNTAEDSRAYAGSHQGFGGTASVKGGTASLDRYMRAVCGLGTLASCVHPVEESFDLLKNVKMNNTKWSVVYDVNNRKVFWKTNQNTQVRCVRLDDFDLACAANSKLLDVHEEVPAQEVSSARFTAYAASTNLNYVEQTFDQLEFLQEWPSAFVRRLGLYPETVNCKE